MFNKDFYPTPTDLIIKMLSKVEMNTVDNILEPSAGKGNIVEYIAKTQQYGKKYQIDTIESESELRMILEGKGYKPISSDFLTFKTYKHYDLVIMNPPFSNGDVHLLKAIKMQVNGGKIVCLLNAETLKNAHTNARKELLALIDKFKGTVEYIDSAFEDAERRTNVEVALIYLNIPYEAPQSDIFQNLVEAHAELEENPEEFTDLVAGGYILSAVRRYEIEIESGLKLIKEYQALRPMLSKSFSNKDYSMIELIIDGDKYGNLQNTLVKCTRKKYWQELFKASEFSQLFTSKTREQYMSQIESLANFEFTVPNIKQMQLDISQSMLGSLENAIVRLFDEFSNQYWDEQSSNIHYYNGWKTNKAYIVNKKVITRASGYSWDSFRPVNNAREKLDDIHKVFSYLDGTLSNQSPVYDILTTAEKLDTTRNVDMPYCIVSFYKKGTTHVVFKDMKLLKKFNLIGSQHKGWLPPSYGKTSYSDLPTDYKQLVDNFEGKESYADTVANYDYYQTNAQPVLALEAAAEESA